MWSLLVRFVQWIMSGALANLLIGGGLTLVVASGIEVLLEDLLNQITSSMSGMPSDILSLSLLFGWGEALSIIGGALLTRVAIKAAANVVGFAKGASA
jgi:hypothetical protein